MSSTTSTEQTLISKTVTVPAGGRDVLYMTRVPYIYHTSSTGYSECNIWQGAVGSTQIDFMGVQGANSIGAAAFGIIHAPSAGSLTLTVGYRNSTGSGTASFQASAQRPIVLSLFLV